MKILLIIGTRPEAIKMAPVYKALRVLAGVEPVVCATAQHRDMLDQVLELFDIQPDIDLNIMQLGQDLYDVTTAVLGGMRDVFRNVQPDKIVVQGDTTTVMAASLAAFYEQIPVGHVEAGLRTGNMFAPFPEEMNRRVTSVIAAQHFAPTDHARNALMREGVPEEKIHVTGNTVIDTLKSIVARLAGDQSLCRRMEEQFPWATTDRGIILVTGHRRENFGEGFRNICDALRRLAERDDVEIVYPVHLNPNARGPVTERLSGKANIHLIPPQDYLSFVYLMDRSHLIVTDSGGVQEEAPSLGKPVLVMREVTERPEAVESGAVQLVGTDPDRIVAETVRLVEDVEHYESVARVRDIYGDGRAGERISRLLADPSAEVAPWQPTETDDAIKRCIR